MLNQFKINFLIIKAKYILKYDIRISTESIVCHTDSINYEIGFLYIIIYIVNKKNNLKQYYEKLLENFMCYSI